MENIDLTHVSTLTSYLLSTLLVVVVNTMLCQFLGKINPSATILSVINCLHQIHPKELQNFMC